MAIETQRAGRPAGRPKIAAIIGSSTDKAIEKREAFFRICQSLTYSERLALANGIGVHFITVQRWHYGSNMPDEQMREDIIDWYEKGKPVRRILQCESITGLY